MVFTRWTRLSLAAVVLGLGLVWAPAPALACSCEGDPFGTTGDASGVENFDAVFIGVVQDNEKVSSDDISWVFEVTSVVHGEVASPIELLAPIDGGACGLDWVSNGSTIAVGVSSWEGRLQTDLCSIDRAEVLNGVGERRPALEPGDPLAINADQQAATIGVSDEEPTESVTSQIILIAIGIVSILAAAALVVVLNRGSD